MNNGTRKTHCKYGHDIAVVGRNKGGACNQCYRDYCVHPERRVVARRNGWKSDGILNEEGLVFSDQDFNRHFQIQGGACKICRKHQSEFDRALCVDHDRQTGLFRGLLCMFCNRNMVGKHTVETALQLLEYLKQPI